MAAALGVVQVRAVEAGVAEHKEEETAAVETMVVVQGVAVPAEATEAMGVGRGGGRVAAVKAG